MDIPINAEVSCADGPCGRSTYIIINPVNQQVTHLVVKEGEFPLVERLVPISSVTESTSTHIRLRCTRAELASMENFIETEYMTGNGPYAGYSAGQYWVMPYGLPQMVPVSLKHERIPPGDLAVHRGAAVVATDGRVGRVDEFLVDPESEHITHLVLREGHLWGQKDVSIPVSQIDHIEEDAVYLKLDRQSIQDLPHIPIKRPMRESAA